MGNAGARKLSAQFETVPEESVSLQRYVTVKVIDAANNKVEFIDSLTNTSLATRTLDKNAMAEAIGLKVNLIGAVDTDDLFHVENNDEGVGDGRAMFEVASLQTGESRSDERGGFQEIFNATVSRLGAMVRTSELSAEASIALKEASLEAESSFSGVNLDAEAANLIEQQQAYQASARILTTARELFETLLGL